MGNFEKIENRFCAITGYNSLSSYPMLESEGFAVDKDKSRDFAEVFTPPHIVDAMLQSVPDLSCYTKNLDLCAGHGQYTIRMLRRFSQDVKNFNSKKYLRVNHFFSELQLESCYKLLWIFGNEINLAIGDALQLAKLPLKWKGIWLYVDEIDLWVNVTNFIRDKFPVEIKDNIEKNPYNEETENNFKQTTEELRSWLIRISKEPKVVYKHLVNFAAGRELLISLVKETSTDLGDNWQEVATPKWIAQEMVRCIPDLNMRKNILVLFNVEFLEALFEEGYPVERITFGADSTLEELMARKMYKIESTKIIGRTLEQMKNALNGCAGQYDVVLSNPPYQMVDGGGGHGSSISIYNEIVTYTIVKLQPKYVCMITPSRWMAGGKGLNNYREQMLTNKHIKLIQDFPGPSEVFKNNDIKGGVSYFLWDRDYNGLCEFNGVIRDMSEFDILVRDNNSISILKKVLSKHDGSYCNEKVLSRKPFGIAANFNNWVSEETQNAIKCHSRFKEENWILKEKITDNNNILNKYKVFTAKAKNLVDSDKTVISQIFIGNPNVICTETYLVSGNFDSKIEAENYLNYMQTKFYRFMLSLRIISQNISKDKFSFVPDFIDYTNPITDKDLYEHFELTRKEIEHIESTIKELN